MIEIRLASYSDVSFLPAIEDAASTLFSQFPWTADLPGSPKTLTEFYDAQKLGQLWVAAPLAGSPIGFAMIEMLGNLAHLEEIDVHPDFGRQGIGASLVKTICQWAQNRKITMVTLTTFRCIPWNEPFYRKLGFEELKSGELTPDLIKRIDEEERRGLSRNLRIAMGYKTQAA